MQGQGGGDAGESVVWIDPDILTVIAGTWARSDVPSQARSGYLYNSTRATGDKLRGTFFLPKGTFKIIVVTATGTAGGILKIDVDGVNAAAFDCYAASGPNYNQIKTQTGVSIGSDGYKQIDVYSNTKNAGSSNFDMYLTDIMFVRTA